MRTAAAFDPEPYARGHRERNAAERAAIDARLERAKRLAQDLAVLLGGQPGVKRVTLFGSVAEGTARGLDFDLDLAVEGGDHWALLDLVEGHDIRVDLADWDGLPEHMRSRIRERGTVLWEAGGLVPRHEPGKAKLGKEA